MAGTDRPVVPTMAKQENGAYVQVTIENRVPMVLCEPLVGDLREIGMRLRCTMPDLLAAVLGALCHGRNATDLRRDTIEWKHAAVASHFVSAYLFRRSSDSAQPVTGMDAVAYLYADHRRPVAGEVPSVDADLWAEACLAMSDAAIRVLEHEHHLVIECWHGRERLQHIKAAQLLLQYRSSLERVVSWKKSSSARLDAEIDVEYKFPY